MTIKSSIYTTFFIFNCELFYVAKSNFNQIKFSKGAISVLAGEYYVVVQKQIFTHGWIWSYGPDDGDSYGYSQAGTTFLTFIGKRLNCGASKINKLLRWSVWIHTFLRVFQRCVLNERRGARIVNVVFASLNEHVINTTQSRTSRLIAAPNAINFRNRKMFAELTNPERMFTIRMSVLRDSIGQK